MANIGRWAAGVPISTYAIDDETALKVSGGTVEVVFEGHWRLFTSSATSDLLVHLDSRNVPQRRSN